MRGASCANKEARTVGCQPLTINQSIRWMDQSSSAVRPQRLERRACEYFTRFRMHPGMDTNMAMDTDMADLDQVSVNTWKWTLTWQTSIK